MADNEKNGQLSIGNLLKLAGATLGGWVLYSAFFIDHRMSISPALDAERVEFLGKQSTFLSYYHNNGGTGRPLVLIHSINAAASAYEVKPFFEHYRPYRPIYALDLPGFGFSDRTNRPYTPELYTRAILDLLATIGEKADVIALSLSSEFVARAALIEPERFNSITMISPTGLHHRQFDRFDPQQSFQRFTHRLLTNPLYAQAVFDLIATRSSIQYFLQQSFEYEVNPGLAQYAWLTAHQPGARFAPLTFISGLLFTPNAFDNLYMHLEVPTIALYDRDPYTGFDRIPEILSQRGNWRARRIPRTRGLPHFERLDKVTEALDDFWTAIG